MLPDHSDLVLVKWTDAVAVPGWHSRDSITLTDSDSSVYTAGVAVYTDDELICIAQSFGMDDEADVLNLQWIPVKLIQFCCKLQIGS